MISPFFNNLRSACQVKIHRLIKMLAHPNSELFSTLLYTLLNFRSGDVNQAVLGK